MAIIIDANRTGDFSAPFASHALEIIKRFSTRRMRICLGGKLTKELSKTKIAKLLGEWSRAGYVDRFSDSAVNAKADSLLGSIQSDDEHVLALVCVSGCRLIYTNDVALILDLKNPRLVSPKGKVVKSTTANRFAYPLFDRLGK